MYIAIHSSFRGRTTPRRSVTTRVVRRDLGRGLVFRALPTRSVATAATSSESSATTRNSSERDTVSHCAAAGVVMHVLMLRRAVAWVQHGCDEHDDVVVTLRPLRAAVPSPTYGESTVKTEENKREKSTAGKKHPVTHVTTRLIKRSSKTEDHHPVHVCKSIFKRTNTLIS